MLPDGWTTRRFGDIASFRNGLNFTKSNIGESIKIVGVSDFQKRTELANTTDLATIRVATEVRDTELLRSGDLLFVRSNGNKALIGRCLFFPKVTERLAFSGFTIRGRVDRNVIAPIFASYLVRSKVVSDQIFQGGSGTNISNLSQEILAGITIRVPPLSEQEHIARVLATWDEAVATTERLLATSRKQKQALIDALVSERKTLRKRKTEWKQSTLRQVADIVVSSVDKKREVSEREVQLCNYTDVYYNDRIHSRLGFMQATASDREIEKFTLRCGDVIITKDSETPADIAVSARVTEEVPNLVCGYHLAVIRPNRSRIDPIFLQSYFNLTRTKSYFASKANGVTRFGLPLSAIEDAPLLLPSIAEQQQIALVISNAESEVASRAREVGLLKLQGQALQTQLLTGKRRVHASDSSKTAV